MAQARRQLPGGHRLRTLLDRLLDTAADLRQFLGRGRADVGRWHCIPGRAAIGHQSLCGRAKRVVRPRLLGGQSGLNGRHLRWQGSHLGGLRRQAQCLLDESALVDQQVGRGLVGRRWKAYRQHRGSPVETAQFAQHWGEVSVGRQHDELVIARLMLQQFDNVEHHVDVGAGLALAGHRRAIDDFETRPQKGVSVGLVPVRVEIAAPYQQAPSRLRVVTVGDFQGFGQPAYPLNGLAREALGGRRLQLAQLGVDVVEIDKKCAFHESSGVFGDRKVFRSLVLLPGSCLPAGSLSGMDGRPSRYWPGATPVHCLKAR